MGREPVQVGRTYRTRAAARNQERKLQRYIGVVRKTQGTASPLRMPDGVPEWATGVKVDESSRFGSYRVVATD